MFVRYYVELPVAFEEVEMRLLQRPEGWVPGLAEVAEGHGANLLADVGFAARGRRIGKHVKVEICEAIRFPSKTALPMTWRATGRERFFPSLDADLEVAALGPSLTQLSISARYRPPLGAVGRVIDRALLHRVAEATIKDFLDRVAASLLDLSLSLHEVRPV